MRILGVLGASILVLSGCATPGAVQRIGVDYNTAVAGMANEVTLLNVLRAKEGFPLHYTGFNRISGSLVVTAGTSFNTQIRDDATTGTDTTATTMAPTGATTVATIARQVLSGGTTFTPQVSGQIVSGPSFEVSIYDTQKFYQGILAPIPFQTIENYLDQGFPNQLLMRLLIARIEFRLKADGPGDLKAGRLIKTISNEAAGTGAEEFAHEVACWTLQVQRSSTPTTLAPVARVTGLDGATELRLQDLALLDGKALDLSGPLTTDPLGDRNVSIVRVGASRVAHLAPMAECPYEVSEDAPANAVGARHKPGELPAAPPAGPVYVGAGKVAVSILADGEHRIELLETNMQITFRSTQGVFQFLGDYLEAAENPDETTWRLGPAPLFSIVRGDGAGERVSASLNGARWEIAEANQRRNMQVLGLLEQLVNLHKDSADRPVTQPVRVVQ